MSPHQPPFSRLLTIASNFYIAGILPKRTMKQLIFMVRKPQVASSKKRYYIQAFALDHIPAYYFYHTYQNVYVIHIVRDPRTFIPSYLNWIKTRKRSFIANHFVPGWHPNGYLTREIPFKQWMRMKPYQKISWLWVYKNKYIETSFRGTRRYALVFFEDLFSSKGPEVLEEALAVSGIPYRKSYDRVFAMKRNESRKIFCPAWHEWSVPIQDKCIKICGDLMKHYGYF